MTRLIDADALNKNADELIAQKGFTVDHEGGDTDFVLTSDDVRELITNSPTVQREGWVSVPIEPNDTMLLAAVKEKIGLAIHDAKYKKLIMEYKKDIKNEYKAMIQAAPTDKE